MDPDSWPQHLVISLVIVLLLLCAAYFAVAETAFASVSRIRVKARLDKGDVRARRAMYILDNFDKAITTILIGTNITHLVTAALATVLATRLWGLGAAAACTVVTTLVVFFAAEMLPKSIGKKYSERLALAVSASLCFFMKLFTPVSAVLTAVGHFAAKLTRGDGDVTVTEDELYDIIETMKDEGELDAQRGELVHSALLFADVTVESVLTARVDVAALPADASCREILDFIKAQRHSRIPVYKDSIDNIVGVLQIRKYIKAWLRQGEATKLEDLLDEAYFVPRSVNIHELLSEMSRKKRNMAIVMDSYGGTPGIVTVEDLLEALVGDIWDEEDEVVVSCQPQADGSFLLDPGLTVEEAFQAVSFDDPSDFDFAHKILGEWVYEQFDHIPDVGDEFAYNGLRLAVAARQQRRITQLRAWPPAPATEGGGAA